MEEAPDAACHRLREGGEPRVVLGDEPRELDENETARALPLLPSGEEAGLEPGLVQLRARAARG